MEGEEEYTTKIVMKLKTISRLGVTGAVLWTQGLMMC
jgi:hypothetical protein